MRGGANPNDLNTFPKSLAITSLVKLKNHTPCAFDEALLKVALHNALHSSAVEEGLVAWGS